MQHRKIPLATFQRYISEAKWMEIAYGKEGDLRYVTPAGNQVEVIIIYKEDGDTAELFPFQLEINS